jgi:hypothetical protein
MEKKVTAKNTLYFKAWNADYRIDGIYHNLDSSEFRIIVILQSYADNQGYIRSDAGHGYNMSQELTKMIGLNYRTVLRGLMSLADKGIVNVDGETNVIRLNHFVDDNVYRENDNKKSTFARRQMAQNQASIQSKLDDIDRKVSNPIVVTEGNGEIKETVNK